MVEALKNAIIAAVFMGVAGGVLWGVNQAVRWAAFVGCI